MEGKWDSVKLQEELMSHSLPNRTNVPCANLTQSLSSCENREFSRPYFVQFMNFHHTTGQCDVVNTARKWQMPRGNCSIAEFYKGEKQQIQESCEGGLSPVPLQGWAQTNLSPVRVLSGPFWAI